MKGDPTVNAYGERCGMLKRRRRLMRYRADQVIGTSSQTIAGMISGVVPAVPMPWSARRLPGVITNSSLISSMSGGLIDAVVARNAPSVKAGATMPGAEVTPAAAAA